MSFLLQLLALLTLFAMAVGLRLVTGSWFHPTSLFSAYWASLLALSIIAGFTPAPVMSWMIVAGCVAVALGAPLRLEKGAAPPNHLYVASFIPILVLAGSVGPVLAAFLTHSANGQTIVFSAGLSGILESARQISLLRYEETLYTPPLATVLLGFCYAGALVSPAVAVSKGLWISRLWLALPALGSAAYTVLTTARAPFVIAVIITFASWITVESLRSGGRPTLPLRSWLAIAGAGLAVVLMFAVAAISRATAGVEVFKAFSLYASGSIPANDAWLRSGYSPGGLTFGARSLAGISQFWLNDLDFGGPRPDFTEVAPGYTTNVYSLFRDLAEDFGLGGGLLALAILGVFCSIAWRSAVLLRSPTAAGAQAIVLSVLLFSQSVSLLTFANVTFGLGIGLAGWIIGVRITPAGGTVCGPRSGFANGRGAPANTESVPDRGWGGAG